LKGWGGWVVEFIGAVRGKAVTGGKGVGVGVGFVRGRTWNQ